MAIDQNEPQNDGVRPNRLTIVGKAQNNAGKALVTLAICFVFCMTGCGVPEGQQAESPGSDSQRVDPEAVGRDFLMGMVPSSRSIPDSSFDDLVNAYQDLGDIAEVAMI